MGRISCIVCGIQIKSEHAWNAHIISKTHKQNEAREAQVALKRSMEDAPVQLSVLTKRSKPDGDKIVPLAGREISISQTQITSQTTLPSASSSPPPTAAKIPTDTAALGEKNPTEKTRDDLSGSKLPEGFFDDRYKDAKVRNVPYRDKLIEEMEVFQKEMISLEKVMWPFLSAGTDCCTRARTHTQ
ncbi:unnamed protein product [Echinostoma caproni]|uniref:Zinc finger protein 830 n=1 Tax=Echinostoma caproni TaxID=27848 RepID=A0A3P8HNB9_9TREM|nr:unnamed protein product [Echinostoma caproni]